MQRRRHNGSTLHADHGATPVKRQLTRAMRNAPTPAEALLCKAVRAEALGVKFRRQHPIAGFIADFYAPQIRCVVEADGPVHAPSVDYDAARDGAFERLGIVVVRVKNSDVLNNLPGVVARISEAVRELLAARPPGPGSIAHMR